jgi:transcriptional regulator with XRE-family HTH domain
MRQHKFHGEWCQMFRKCLEKLESQGVFASRTGISIQMINAYFTGRSKPPLEQLDTMADALHLVGEPRRRFLWLAQEHYVPPAVWARCSELETLLLRTQEELAQARADIANARAQLASANLELAGLNAQVLRIAERLTGVDHAQIEGTK